MSASTVVGGQKLTGTVVLSGRAPAGGQNVTFNLDPSQDGTIPKAVTVAANATTATFTVTYKTVTKKTVVTTWGNSGPGQGKTLSFAVTVTPAVAPPPPPPTKPTISSVTVNSASVPGGTAITGTVHLTAAAPTGGAVVALSAAGTGAAVLATITIPAGALTGPFTITTSVVTANVTDSVSATYGNTASVSFAITAPVAPPPPPPPPPPVDTTAPTVAITFPAPGATVSGTITATANATDNVGIASVQFNIDGVSQHTETVIPYTDTIDTTTLVDGSHTLTAIAKDAAGNIGNSTGVAFTVKNAVAPPPPPPPPPPATTFPPAGATFFDDFTQDTQLNTSKWEASDYESNSYAGAGVNMTFSPKNIDFTTGCMRMTLTTPTATTGTGAELQSNKTLGFGTYTVVMRMSSTAATPTGLGDGTKSGCDSSMFIYINNSQTEIDIESVPVAQPAGGPSNIWLTSWQTESNSSDNEGANYGLGDLTAGFHTYQIIWAAGKVTWTIDGQTVFSTTKDVSSTPAYLMFNHWGTNIASWGGKATPGLTRYMYVKSVSFVPQS